jgi:hypothetical protein
MSDEHDEEDHDADDRPGGGTDVSELVERDGLEMPSALDEGAQSAVLDERLRDHGVTRVIVASAIVRTPTPAV